MDDVDLNRTAGDEAKETQQQRKRQVLVTCAIPQGIVLANHLNAKGEAIAAANLGPGSPIEVKGSKPVDEAFWNAWKKHNQALFDQGLVSAIPIEEQAENEALENGGEVVGQQGEGDPEQDLEPSREGKDA